MFVSYKWLQSYFGEPLPEPEKLAELLTFSFAEVESVEKKGDDAIFDVKVLPDRACYALSHRGVAYEVAAITGLRRKAFNWPQPEIAEVRKLDVKVEDTELCPRYMARVIENVVAKEQAWVKEHLEAMGQRSINPIVDGANIVMFDMGQPLHAFDADKVKGGIVVRRARKGEKITTLDNRKVILDESILVIADHKEPLAVAGIKGGKKAEVTADTRNLILESANFNASYVRKTSDRLGIKTEASKRYENRISPELAAVGMSDFTAYLFEMDKHLKAAEIIDVPESYSNVLKNIRITSEYISEKLGCPVEETDLEKILLSLGITVEKKKNHWLLAPPFFRLDLAIPEDIVEEVGRLVGYDKIPPELPPKQKSSVEIPKSFYYEWKIREILVGAGFSEIMTSSFSEKGSVAIEKPLAEDKRYARPDLRGSFAKTLKMNALNAPLFGNDEVRIFEIGRVFTADGEHAALALGFSGPKKKATTELASVAKFIGEKLDSALSGETKDAVFECNLDNIIEELPEPREWDISIPAVQNEKFQPFSPYPFIVRDIALFVPTGIVAKDVVSVIKKETTELLVVGPTLFDTFEKGDKKSFAFRMVFQSSERTLTDEEVNGFMEKIYRAVKSEGWAVR